MHLPDHRPQPPPRLTIPLFLRHLSRLSSLDNREAKPAAQPWHLHSQHRSHWTAPALSSQCGGSSSRVQKRSQREQSRVESVLGRLALGWVLAWEDGRRALGSDLDVHGPDLSRLILPNPQLSVFDWVHTLQQLVHWLHRLDTRENGGSLQASKTSHFLGPRGNLFFSVLYFYDLRPQRRSFQWFSILNATDLQKTVDLALCLQLRFSFLLPAWKGAKKKSKKSGTVVVTN